MFLIRVIVSVVLVIMLDSIGSRVVVLLVTVSFSILIFLERVCLLFMLTFMISFFVTTLQMNVVLVRSLAEVLVFARHFLLIGVVLHLEGVLTIFIFVTLASEVLSVLLRNTSGVIVFELVTVSP
jgi:hypothetical protein